MEARTVGPTDCCGKDSSRKNTVGEKVQNWECPTLRFPTLRGPTLRAPPFGPPTLWAPETPSPETLPETPPPPPRDPLPKKDWCGRGRREGVNGRRVERGLRGGFERVLRGEEGFEGGFEASLAEGCLRPYSRM